MAELKWSYGTIKSFQNSGGDVTWSINSVGNGAGRISAQLDLGASPRPLKHQWTLLLDFATATVGNLVRLYFVTAEGAATTYQEGVIGTADAALTTEDLLKYGVLRVFSLPVMHTTASNCWRGEIDLPGRYVSVALWNASGVALSASGNECRLEPMHVNSA